MKDLSIPNWEFYYEKNNHSEVIVEVKRCKKPSRTSTWKNLHKLLNENSVKSDENGIKSVGYRLIHPTGTIISKNSLTA